MKLEDLFEKNCMETSVPESIIELVSMIAHSLDIESQIETETTKYDLFTTFTIQLSSESKKRNTMLQKHSISRETPFVIYVGLLLFAKKKRKRQLIEILHQYDICISYDSS